MPRLEPILSPAEIESLLTESSRARARLPALDVDLVAEDRHLRGLLPLVGVGFSRLAESLRRVLTSVLRTKVEVVDEEPEIVSGRGMAAIASRAACLTALATRTPDAASGFAVLAFDPVITFRIIERMFGGGGGPPQTPGGRSPTALERRMLMRAIAPMIDALNTTLEPANYFSFAVHSVESRLDLVPGYNPDTTAMHVPFTLKIGDQIASFSLALPGPLLEPLRAHTAPAAADARPGPGMSELMHEVQVTVSVVLGRASMSLRRLGRLEVGTVITLDRGRNDELPVQVEGRTKWAGQPIQQDGMVAVELTRRTP